MAVKGEGGRQEGGASQLYQYQFRERQDVTWKEIWDQLLVCIAELRVWVSLKFKRCSPLPPRHACFISISRSCREELVRGRG